MFFSKHKSEIVLYSYEADEEAGGNTIPDEDNTASTTSGAHCAWCGDPSDEFGSHGICAFHQTQMLEQAAERRRSRGQS